MKLKTTKANLKSNYNRIISIGYCDAQYLLQYENPFSYCAGVSGWSCDNYEIGGVLISTGYSPISSKNADKDYAKMCEYEAKARAIVCDGYMAWEVKKERVTELLMQFINECTQIAKSA